MWWTQPGVLVPHVNDSGAHLNPRGACGNRGEQRERRGLLLGEVVNPKERSVDADFLRGHSQINRLQERVPGGTHARTGDVSPVAKGQKPDLFHKNSHLLVSNGPFGMHTGRTPHAASGPCAPALSRRERRATKGLRPPSRQGRACQPA